jgi:hypothetical protein
LIVRACGKTHGNYPPTEGAGVTSTTVRAVARPDSSWDEQTSDDDVFGIARYLADAVEHGEISEADGERALLEWAAPDPQVLVRAARHLAPDSEAEHLLRAAYHHAA